MKCLLCESKQVTPLIKNPNFYNCSNCGSCFRNPNTFLSLEQEKERYLNHNNDVDDLGYQKFVTPLVEAVKANFINSAKGLDFGAGTGPVITKLLGEQGFRLDLYDPFFHNNKEVLNKQYDYIVCCEVIEHFHNPLKEFKKLFGLLKPRGKLFCMTDLLTSEINFKDWYYKNDPTHVIFYSEKNLEWIKRQVRYSQLEINKRIVVFVK